MHSLFTPSVRDFRCGFSGLNSTSNFPNFIFRECASNSNGANFSGGKLSPRDWDNFRAFLGFSPAFISADAAGVSSSRIGLTWSVLKISLQNKNICKNKTAAERRTYPETVGLPQSRTFQVGIIRLRWLGGQQLRAELGNVSRAEIVWWDQQLA